MPALGLALISGLMFAGCGTRANSSANANNEPPVVDITTAQAIVRPIPTYIEATGNLASDAQTDVAPAVAGKIAEVNFDIGSYVTKGSVLVRLDPRDAALRLKRGQSVLLRGRDAPLEAEAVYAVSGGVLIATGSITQGEFVPHRVFNL